MTNGNASIDEWRLKNLA